MGAIFNVFPLLLVPVLIYNVWGFGSTVADSERGKTELRNRRIDDAFIAELFPKPARHFIRAVIFGDFLAHYKNVFVSD